MKKNEYNIKTYYIKVFMNLCEELNHYPEQEMKVKYLKEFLTFTKSASQELNIIFAYMMDRLVNTSTGSSFYFSEVPDEPTDELTKLNMIQLKYSAENINNYASLEETVQDFVYSFSGQVQEFLRHYYNCTNPTGIRIGFLEEIYNNGGYNNLIKHPSLSEFAYEAQQEKRKIKQRKVKLPAIRFLEEKPNLIRYVKVNGYISCSNNIPEDIRRDLDGILANYNNITIIGNLENGNTIKTYICTTKEQVCKGLFRDGRFTIQNSFRYLMGDFKRVNNSIKKVEDWTSLKRLVKADGKIFYDMGTLLEELEHRESCCILFRNEFIETKKITFTTHIVKELDFTRDRLVTEYHNGKENEFRIKENFIGNIDELEIGDKVKIVGLGSGYGNTKLYTFVWKG